MDRTAPGVMQMKMLDAILGPGTKSSMCVPLDLRTLRKVAIETAITFPPKSTGVVEVSLRASVDNKVYDDQDFHVFSVPAPDWNSPFLTPEEARKPITLFKVVELHAPVFNFLKAVAHNKTVNMAVIAKVWGLWLPEKERGKAKQKCQ